MYSVNNSMWGMGTHNCTTTPTHRITALFKHHLPKVSCSTTQWPLCCNKLPPWSFMWWTGQHVGVYVITLIPGLLQLDPVRCGMVSHAYTCSDTPWSPMPPARRLLSLSTALQPHLHPPFYSHHPPCCFQCKHITVTITPNRSTTCCSGKAPTRQHKVPGCLFHLRKLGLCQLGAPL